MKDTNTSVHKRHLRPLTAVALVAAAAWITMGVEGCCDPNNPDCTVMTPFRLPLALLETGSWKDCSMALMPTSTV